MQLRPLTGSACSERPYSGSKSPVYTCDRTPASAWRVRRRDYHRDVGRSRDIKHVLRSSRDGEADRELLHLLSVPLLGAADDAAPSPQRIGAISISVALLEPQLSDR